MTPAQQDAKEKAFELLTEHFSACLLVLCAETPDDNKREATFSYDGGQCQALGLAKYAEHKIMDGFEEG